MAFTRLAHVVGQSGNSDGFTTDGSGAHGSSINTTGANLLVYMVSCLTGTTPTVSDLVGGNSNVWTSIESRDSTNVTKGMLFYSIPTHVGSGHTFTITGAGSFPSIFVAAYQGAASTPLDQHTGATAVAVTTIATGSVTPSTANQLVVTGLATGVNPSSVDSGFSIIDSANTVGGQALGGGLAEIFETTIVAKNATWTVSAASLGDAAMIATFTAGSIGQMFLVF